MVQPATVSRWHRQGFAGCWAEDGSERTVSRYPRNRMRAPSQSWRTFLANDFGQLAFASTVTQSDAPGDHDVADAHRSPSWSP